MRSSENKEYLLVGVTGGIGSGKSTVCRLFERLGRPVLSADEIARELTEKDDYVRKRIQKIFGEQIYMGNGGLDRKRVASMVFTSRALRKKLDSVVHPSVFKAIEQRIKELPEAQRRPYVIIEAALIYETGMDKWLDRVIVVQAQEETRISRVMMRDGSSREAVLQRVKSQSPADEKAARADFIIVNEENRTALESKVAFIDTLLQRMNSPMPA